MCQWFNVLNCRSELKSALNFSILKNYWLLGGLALGNALHFLVIYAEPMNRIFHTAPIPLAEFFLIGAVASLVYGRKRSENSLRGDPCRAWNHWVERQGETDSGSP